MTTAHCCWCSFTHAWWIFPTAVRVGSKPVSSRTYLYLNETAPSLFMGALLSAQAG